VTYTELLQWRAEIDAVFHRQSRPGVIAADGTFVSLADIERDLAPWTSPDPSSAECRTGSRKRDAGHPAAAGLAFIYYRALCECAQRSMR
jgi:hypothetical protein